MNNLTRSSYGELVATAFAVIASFHLLMVVLGMIAAVASPSLFNWNGEPAQGAVQALGILAAMLVMLLLIDALACAVGAAVWVLVRRLLPRRAPA